MTTKPSDEELKSTYEGAVRSHYEQPVWVKAHAEAAGLRAVDSAAYERGEVDARAALRVDLGPLRAMLAAVHVQDSIARVTGDALAEIDRVLGADAGAVNVVRKSAEPVSKLPPGPWNGRCALCGKKLLPLACPDGLSGCFVQHWDDCDCQPRPTL